MVGEGEAHSAINGPLIPKSVGNCPEALQMAGYNGRASVSQHNRQASQT